jgi:hypothetical protein
LVKILIVLALLVVAAVVPARAERQQAVTHFITVEVQCLQTAMEQLGRFAGYNLHTAVDFVEQPGFGRRNRASVTRRVEPWALRHTQEALRGMGEVLEESENARYLGAQMRDHEVRVAAFSGEIERLAQMMARSDTLDVLIAIDNQLAWVMQSRNSHVGRLNALRHQAAAAVMNITLIEYFEAPEPQEDYEQGFLARMGDSFLSTAVGMRDGGAAFAVWLARYGLAIAIWLAILSPVAIVAWRVYKRLKSPHL